MTTKINQGAQNIKCELQAESIEPRKRRNLGHNASVEAWKSVWTFLNLSPDQPGGVCSMGEDEEGLCLVKPTAAEELAAAQQRIQELENRCSNNTLMLSLARRLVDLTDEAVFYADKELHFRHGNPCF